MPQPQARTESYAALGALLIALATRNRLAESYDVRPLRKFRPLRPVYNWYALHSRALTSDN